MDIGKIFLVMTQPPVEVELAAASEAGTIAAEKQAIADETAQTYRTAEIALTQATTSAEAATKAKEEAKTKLSNAEEQKTAANEALTQAQTDVTDAEERLGDLNVEGALISAAIVELAAARDDAQSQLISTHGHGPQAKRTCGWRAPHL